MVVTPENIRTTDEGDVENAIKETGFGKFNIKVGILCGLIYMNTGIGISSVSFILPSAACDLQLTTIAKGRISSTSLLGMFLGSYFWGCLAEIQGRRVALLLALFSYGVLEIICSFVTNYWVFLLLKFFTGCTINGQSVIVFTYLGEFQPNEYRDRILSWMEMAWTLGLIVLPLTAWGIIPIQLAYVSDYVVFRSWNLFIILCAIPSLLLGLWLLFFPETPKHLAENKQQNKLSKVLEIMHSQNTGGSFNEYLDKLSKNGHDRLRQTLMLARSMVDKKSLDANSSTDMFPTVPSMAKTQLIWKILRSIYVQSIRLWKPPYLRSTIITCGLFYCIGSSYYALMLWFPEVFQRFATFEINQPTESMSVCKVSSFNRTIIDFNDRQHDCPSTVENEVFVQAIILGLACLPVGIILPLCVDKLGYKLILDDVTCYIAVTLIQYYPVYWDVKAPDNVLNPIINLFSTAAASSVTVGLFFVNSTTQNLLLSCIFEAFSSVCLSAILSLTVDLFPTELRVMAASISAVCGRLGALIGNTLFGYLIDDYCTALIATIASQLFLATVICLLIPGKPTSPGC